ncbi:hypothetical protein CLOM_g3261 [Closterium sp. NIES-68]|nr:hypothetical protein CLOM_g3261 [Closterium sp. NIES-68]
MAVAALLTYAVIVVCTGTCRAFGLKLGRYIPPGPNDARGPCPAFNTMANHGVFPRDGSPVSLSRLIFGFRQFLSVSPSLTLAFYAGARSLGLTTNGRVDPLKLRTHNKIEHDVSLVRDDSRLGSNYVVNHTMIDQLVSSSSDGKYLTMRDMAKFRRERVADSRANNPDLTFGPREDVIGLGEAAFLFAILGNPLRARAIPLGSLTSFLRDEKLPKGFRPPFLPIGPAQMGLVVGRLKATSALLKNA